MARALARPPRRRATSSSRSAAGTGAGPRPRHLRARVAIGRLLEEFGRLGEAEALYRDLAETHPDRDGALYQLGRMALAQSDLAAAVSWLERAWPSTRATGRPRRSPGPWPSSTASRRLAAWPAALTRLPDILDAHLLVAWVEERAGRIGPPSAC